MTFIQPLFGGFFPMAVYCAVGAIRWVMADDGVRQPPKSGCIIVAPGWLAYLGLVVERKK